MKTRYEVKKKESRRLNESLLEFIRKSPSAFQAVETLRQKLLSEGFSELSEGAFGRLCAGDYFVTRNHSSLIAFSIPEGASAPLSEQKKAALLAGGFRIAASHSDSPSFKIKENPELSAEKAYVKLNVEKYGGMLCAPWFDRPLSAAGRIFVRAEEKKRRGRRRASEESALETAAAPLSQAAQCGAEWVRDGIREILVDIPKDLLLIPNVAIHMNRQVNEGYAYNPQVDMLPLFAAGEADGRFMKEVAEAAGVKPQDILGHDLYLYNRAEGSIWGPDAEFVSAPRLDDLQCAFSTMQGFLCGARHKHLGVLCVLDNEEVGSATRQGAGSTFLYDTLRGICGSLALSEADYAGLLQNSRMVSADNAHAVHPNHGELTDPTNRPYIGRGIVIKYNAQQKYCTDGYSAAWFKLLCEEAGVPYQSYVNRSDMLGGSTLGNISNTKVALSSVDIGLPQLAMHSPYETAGTADTVWLAQAMEQFFC